MKRSVLNFKNAITVVLSGLILMFGGCEIGLGAAVDTTRPEVAITYPPKGAVIMDAFKLAGTVSDDAAVKKMVITLKNLDVSNATFILDSEKGQIVIKEPESSWKQGTTWYADIGKKDSSRAAYNGWDLPDGNYNVTVEAYDIYGKKTDSRAFSVDNTPPVFVCETLTSITDPSKNVFGHTISLKGEAKDSSEINKIYFDVFDDTKKLLSSSMDYKMTYEGIVIAQYSDTVPTDESKKILKENYDTIYGITQASPSFSDVKNFYLSFRLADEARIYNNPVYDSKTEVTGSGEGNISTELFLKTEDFDNSKLTAEKISDYKKHLSEDSTTEAELNKLKASSVAEVPSTNENLSKTTRIQINPDIFPKWSVSSKEKPVTGDCPDLHAGSTFDIQFEKGNNKTEFRPSNIRVVLARLDDNGNPYATEDALKNQADSDANVIVLAKKGVMTTDMKEEFHESFKAEMKDNNGNDLIKTSTNYQIMVFGFDGSGTTENTGYEFKPKNTNGYGFRIIKAGAPAEVSFLAGDTTKQEYQNLPKNSNYMGPEVPVSGEQAIWFKVKTTNVELKDLPKVNVTMNGKDLLSEGYFDVVKKNENGVEANTLTDYQADNTTEGSDKYIYIFKWSLKKLKALPLTDEWNKEFEMKVAVTAQDKETSAVTANIMFNYDNKKPELKAGTPSPVVNVDNDSFINGTVLIPVEYSDGQGFATGTEATWEAVCSNENHNHSAVKGTVKNENSISLNTLQSSFTDGEAIKLKLSVKDKYGNVKEIFTPEYKILQSTDIPKIEFVNLYSGTEESKNNFGITMNSTIAAEVSDDDGVAKVRARAKKKTANWTKTTSDAFTDNTEWTDVEVRNSQITWDFKKANKITEDGQYTVQFAVKDIVGNLTNSTFVTGEYSIIADSTYPAFGTETVTNANTDNGMHYVKKNQSVEIKVPLTEVNLKTVKVDGTELTDANIKAHTAAGASDKVDWDITYTWNPGSETTGQKDVVFEAEDLSGNTSSYRVKLYYDAELPEITEFTVSPVYDESKTPSVVNGMLTLKWKVQDNTGKYDTTSPVKLSAKDKNNKEGIATASQTSSEGTIKLNTTKLSDNSAFADKGNIVFTVTVKDFAGNEKSQTFTYYLNQETDKPVITFNSDLIDETLLTHDDVENKTKNPNSKNMFSLNGNNILSGTVTDDDAVGSVEIIAYKNDGTTRVNTSKSFTSNGKTSFDCNIKDALGITDQGNYVITITAKDDKSVTGLDAENVSTKSVKIVVDGVAPVISNIKVGGTAYDKQVYLKAGQKNITFDVEEMHLSKVSYVNVNGTETELTLPTPDTTGGSKKYSMTVPYTPSASGTLVLKAKDNTGLEASSELKIIYDATAPVIETPTVSPVITYKNIANTVNGTISVSGIITDNDKVLDDKVEVKLYRTDDNGTTWTQITAGFTPSVSNMRYSVTSFDTTALKDKTDNTKAFKGKIKLEVKATDRAGNEKTESFEYTVDQESDLPVITFTNVTEGTDVEYKTNLFGMGAWVITGTVTDDDGPVASLKVGTENVSVDNSGGFKYTVPHSNGEKGDKTAVFVATDGKTSSVTTSATVKYAIDDQKPKFDTTTLDGKAYTDGLFAKASYDIVFTVSDDNGIEKLEYKSGTSWVTTNITNSGTTYTHKVTGAQDGAKQVTYRLTDTYGRTTETDIAYTVDTTAPSVNNANVTVGIKDKTAVKVGSLASTWFNSPSLIITVPEGAVTDLNLKSEVNYVQGTDEGKFQMTVSNTEPKKGTFSNTRSFSEGTSSVKYTFVDEAGNTNDLEITGIKVDTAAPSVSKTKKADNTDIDYITIDATDGIGKVTVKLTAKDATSGVKTVMLGSKINFSDSEKLCSDITVSGTSYNATKELNFNEKVGTEYKYKEGTQHIWARVIDEAGNKCADVELGTIEIDRTDPVVTISAVKDADSEKDGIQVNKTITISGTASDANASTKVPELKVYKFDSTQEKNKGAEQTATGLITAVSGSTFASWSYKVDTEKLTDETDYLFEVTAEDKSKNYGTASVKLFVSQNTDRPQIVLESIDVSGNTTLNHGNIKGTIKDDDGDVKSFEIQITGDTSTSTADDKWVKADKSATSAATSTKLDFEIPKDSNDKQDGNYRIWFKVTDGGNGTFISSVKLTETEPKEEREPTSLELLAMPRVSTLGAPDTEKGTPVKYTVDSEPAEIKKVWVTRKKADGSENERVELAQNDYYGGKLRPSVIIEVDAEDTVTPKSELTVKYSVNGTDKGKINYTNGKFTDTIDFSSLNGTVTLLFSAADKTGSPNTKSFTVWADNTAPNANGKAITNLSPASDTEVTGTISISANVNDSGSTGSSGVDAASVKYFIPKYSEKTQPATDSAWEALSWSQEGLTVSEVLLQLDISDLSKSDATIADGYEGYEIASGQKVYQIPVWFRIADKMGNVSYVSSNSIKYNPDAARPHVKITYPKHNATTDGGKDYVVMGGELRIAGTAEDNVGIQAVYVQYDINGDGKYNKKDTDWLTSNGYTVVNPVFGTTPDVLDETGSFNNWGVKVSGQQSWNTTFDSSKLPSDTTAAGYYSLEIGNENNTDNKTLNIRVLAVDTDDTTHVSAFSDELHISVNNSVPAFTLPDLVQYSDNTYTSEIQRKTYDENIYISGNNWRLETKVTDDDGISQIKNGTTNLINGGTVDSQLKAITNGYEIKLILDTTQQVINVNLTATDNDSGTKKDSNAEYVVKIDNTAPEFKDGTGVTDLVLWQGMYKGSKIDSNAEVANSNGWTTLASKLSESQSGFDKVIFYAKRVGATSGTRLYNLMEDCGQFRDQNRTNVTDLTYKSDVGLYVLSKTGVTRPDEYTVQISETGIGNNKNIRMGGAVFFGGNYKLISEYIRNSDDKITVKVEEAVPETYTSIDFVYGMVVNNQGESRNDDGSVKGDDGDGMVESWTKSGNDYTWDAAFNSLYIPNGPIEIHAVAFDKAGNYRHGSVSTKIANSAPRITSVTLGTDLNFDDTVSDSEKTTFYAIKNSYGDIDTTEGKDVWDLVTRNETESIGRDWTMKNGLTIEPEFVGGTTPFYYSFTKTVGTAAGSRLTKDNAIKANYSSLSSATGHTGSTGKFFTSSSDKLLEFDNTLLNTATGEYDKASNVDGINTYSIIFWDSQEDDSDPMGNGWCILNMELKQDLVDSERPHAFVHPFFWNGKGSGKNSVTWATNSTTSKSEPKGHIELEKDWLSASGYDSTATSGYQDKDPKVSGTIVIKGTAYDETTLTEVKVTFDDIIDSGITSAYTKLTEKWDSTGNLDTDGYNLSVENLDVSQKGHLAEWTLTLNTEKVSTTADGETVNQTGLDKKVKVYAKDGTGYSGDVSGAADLTVNTVYYAKEDQAALDTYYTSEALANAGTTGTGSEILNRTIEKGSETSTSGVYEYKVYGSSYQYQMDIVPYVTEVVTSLSSMKSNNPSIYNRTANGHYPVQSVFNDTVAPNKSNKTSETVTLKGFNLNGTAAVTDGGTPTASQGQITFSSAALKSNTLTATVNSIPLMNNINNNEAKGDCASTDSDSGKYQNCYNRTPNGDNNNLLTDDIVFDVWEFNDRVVQPANNKIMYNVTMKIDQNDNLVKYAYVTSQKNFFMPSNKNSSNDTTYSNRNDYLVPGSVGLYIDNTNKKAYSSLLAAANQDRYRLFVANTEGDVTEYRGDDTDGQNNYIKDQMYSSIFTSGKVAYHAYYDKLAGQIRLLTGNQITANTGDVTRSASNCQIIADSNVVGRKPGLYVSIAAVTVGNDDVLCAVWHSQATNELLYSYKTKADTENSTGTVSSSDASGGWSKVQQLFTGGGEYCNIVADADGGIHISAYVGGSLQYAYASAYNGTFKTCTVDSNSGNNMTMDVALESVDGTNYRPIPVFAYNSSSGKAKYAKLKKDAWLTTDQATGTSTVKAVSGWTPPEGYENGEYTGNWEITYVPSKTNMQFNETTVEKINVGLWKTMGDNPGRLKNSATGTGSYTKTYGNGSDNGILCYFTGYGSNMETAQMRGSN